MKTLYSLIVLLLLIGIQSCASNNFSRQKYTNFGKAKGIHLLPNSDRTDTKKEDRSEWIKESVTDEGSVEHREEPAEGIGANDVSTDAVSTESEEETVVIAAQQNPEDTLTNYEVIDLDELHRQFNSVSIGGLVSSLGAVGSTVLILMTIESIGSVLILFLPVALAILSFVLLIMAVKRGRQLNRIHTAIGSSPQWTFYLLYVLDILLLCMSSFAILYALVLVILILAILMGGGFY